MINKTNITGIVALVLAACFFGAGFQGGTDKLGTVDLNRLVQESSFGTAQMKNLNSKLKARKDLMDFLSLYKVATTEEAQKLRLLYLKEDITDPEKADLDKLKTKIMESDKAFQALRQRQVTTDADRELLRDYTLRSTAMEETLQRWNEEFQKELGEAQDKARSDTLKKAKDAVAEVGKAGGYTVVLEATVAPYSANDLTDSALKTMNTKG